MVIQKIYHKITPVRLFVAFLAILFVIGTIFYTDYLAKKLIEREGKLISLYAKSLEYVANQNSAQGQAFLLEEIINANTSVPVILTDDRFEPISSKNVVIDSTWSEEKKQTFLKKEVEAMRLIHEPIKVEFWGIVNYVCYKNSHLLTLLNYYPYIQLLLVLSFVVIGYIGFSYSRKAEQNRVWVGLAKETAHQLGTPLSSLLAIQEYFKQHTGLKDDLMVDELVKDTARFQTITNRFSQIGLEGKLEQQRLSEVVQHQITYLNSRLSRGIQLILENTSDNDLVLLNEVLMGWVIENLVKNAVDAMDGKGLVELKIHNDSKYIFLDIIDHGKGIPYKQQQKVFHAGFTTKKRGWGLGLTLVKRIVESYHQGKVFVYKSELNKGTTFRIQFKKA
jgi:two-component sensor histidine kinase